MPYLFPIPRNQKNFKSKIDCSKIKWVLLHQKSSHKIKKQVLKKIRELNKLFNEELTLTLAAPVNGAILLEIRPFDLTLPAQGFKLFVKSGHFQIIGADEAGTFYGLNAFEQIVQQSYPKLACVDIFDYPDLQVRGYMLDISRFKVPQMDKLFRLIDLLSNLRYNQLQFYTEHTFKYTGHDLVWGDYSPMTPEEIIELDIYCQEHFIELVPNQNAFGHLRQWLKHDKYKHLAECPDGFTYANVFYEKGQILKPDAQSIDFIDSLFSELLDNFSSDLVNIGADETIELGLGASKDICKKEGSGRVYLNFLLKLNSLANNYGKKAMFWGDIILHHPELIKELPKDMIALDWGYEAHSPFEKTTRKFADAGVDYYVCPGTSGWLSICGRSDVAKKNISNAVSNCIKNNGKGMLLVAWGDGGTHGYDFVNWVGLCYGAAFSWCYKKNKNIDISSKLNQIAEDDSKTISDYISRIGELHHFEHKCQSGNSTIFGLILEHPCLPEPEKTLQLTLKKVNATQLKQCRKKLLALRDKLDKLDLKSKDASVLKRELLNNNQMVELAILYALSMKCKDKKYLSEANKLSATVISEFESLWIERNRVGGMNLSANILRDTNKNFNKLK
jgi:hypothetical protein